MALSFLEGRLLPFVDRVASRPLRQCLSIVGHRNPSRLFTRQPKLSDDNGYVARLYVRLGFHRRSPYFRVSLLPVAGLGSRLEARYVGPALPGDRVGGPASFDFALGFHGHSPFVHSHSKRRAKPGRSGAGNRSEQGSHCKDADLGVSGQPAGSHPPPGSTLSKRRECIRMVRPNAQSAIWVISKVPRFLSLLRNVTLLQG